MLHDRKHVERPLPAPMMVDHPLVDSENARQDVAELRLVCLVRSGDGYLLRGSGRFCAEGEASQVDISFGDAGDRRAAVQLGAAVRSIQRWCELGTPVSLFAAGQTVTLRAQDGTSIPLPRCSS